MSPVKHPDRQLQPATTHSAVPAAAENGPAHLLNRFVHPNDATGPGMPAIENLPLFRYLGPMGVTAPRCTTSDGRTRAAGASARPRYRPSLTHSPWRRRNSWPHDHNRHLRETEQPTPSVRPNLN